MTNPHPALIVEELRAELRKLQETAEKALAQVDDASFFASLDDQANSLAVIVKHVAGNLRSRWTDFFTTDGEKPDRHRDGEFVVGPEDTREHLMTRWREGWDVAFRTFDGLTPDDLGRPVAIRWETQPAMRAILRSLTHVAGHVGQIVLLAKHARGPQWRTLTIARGQSQAVNDALREAFERSRGAAGGAVGG